MVQHNFSLLETRFMQRLGYTFQNASLLKQALTHRSASSYHNERLEFLGDAILGFLISERLFLAYPNEREGRLSRLRSMLVKGEKLAEIAKTLELGACLYLGPGELKTGGFRRASILSDALEAVFGAIFLDGGLEACRNVVFKLYENVSESVLSHEETRDPKTRLQETLQAKKMPLPVYQLISQDEKETETLFKVQCMVDGLTAQPVGAGGTRKQAEQDAALQFLLWMEARH